METIFINKQFEFKEGIIENNEFFVSYFSLPYQAEGVVSEDSLLIKYEKSDIILAVSDGAGGHPKGEEASYLALDYFAKKKNITDIFSINDLESINDNILDMKVGAKCTLSAVQICENYVNAFSIGDSEIMILDTKGNIIYENIPDSISSYRVEAGIIEQEESLDDPDRHIVTNFLGDKIFRFESTSKIELKRGYTIIVGTDGLFDNISHQEIVNSYKEMSFENFSKSLINRCKIQAPDYWRKPDDIAFCIFRKK